MGYDATTSDAATMVVGLCLCCSCSYGSNHACAFLLPSSPAPLLHSLSLYSLLFIPSLLFHSSHMHSCHLAFMASDSRTSALMGSEKWLRFESRSGKDQTFSAAGEREVRSGSEGKGKEGKETQGERRRGGEER